MPSKSDWVYYPIKGVPVKTADNVQPNPNVKVPLRQNIDQWSRDPANDKQVKLFVMALDRLMKVDPSNRDSFFQIAGIHGQPNVPWDEPLDQAETAGKGYCTHNNILFPIWHRAYLALYEQRLYEIMVKEIIPIFPREARAEWEQAANAWRLPFWDWGLTTSVPELSKYPTTVVPTPDGKGEERIPNPLYQFRMPNNKPMSAHGMDDFKDPWVKNGDMLYFGECIGTSRWPEKEDTASGSSAWRHGTVNNYKVQDALKKPPWVGDSPYGQPAEMVYRLLTVPMEYSTFATTAQLSEDQNVASDVNIEYIHNNVHGWVGGDFNGHMSQIPVATFDPLFWLHHCNIDRIFALWQALNPEKWFEKSEVNDFFQETIGLPEGTVITPNTGLRPFHKDTKGTLMTPEDVRWFYTLGYSYPELQTWKEQYNSEGFSSQAFLSDLRKTINELYGISRKSLVDASLNLKGVEYFDEGVKSLDYAFSIRYYKYAFGGEPFWIRIYLSQDGVTQNASLDLITEVYNFSQKPEDESGKLACSNCKNNQLANIKSTANISITPVLISLLKAGKDLASLSKDEVLKFIQKRAYWRVFKAGKQVPRYALDPLGLEIIGNTNDATTYKDPTKAPVLENFVEEPTISGGADGALDPSLKQPVTVPPAPKPDIPKATLRLNSSLPFKASLKADNVVIVDSASLNLTPETDTNTIDNTQVWFSDGTNGDGDILFLLSIRRAEKQIVFNTRINNSWGREVRVSLEKRFKGGDVPPSILIHDQEDGYEVFIDWKHVLWFEKRTKDKVARSVSYTVNNGQTPVWSSDLRVKVYDSMKSLFDH
ncbi:common central domain of tyrosinase-domain-containing protein [Aspergillus egyptiacus]|nr:common central domain of tyrosinase-domain-containing protein [Aspergillus egyptiacus]